MSEVFCMAPFTHMYVTPGERQERLCCTAAPHSNVAEWDLQKRWTSAKYVDLRKQMMKEPSDEIKKLCSRCLDVEARGDTSDRQRFNEMYNDVDVKFISGNKYQAPIDLDLRPGNLCNLACRMCWSGSSSQIEKEVKKTGAALMWFMGPGNVKLADWSSKDNFEFLLKNVDKGRRLKFLGGEPTIMPEVHEMLDILIDRNLTDIHIHITTNVTNVNKTFMNRLEKFKNLSINYSIDGTGKTVEYVRHPVSWDAIQKNILEYEKIAKNSTINYTLQAYNLHNMKEFVDWTQSINVKYHVNMVTSPEWDSVYVLPKEYRQKYLKDININATNHILKNDSEYSIINFIRNTKILDMSRNQHIKDYIPELWEIIQEDYDALQI